MKIVITTALMMALTLGLAAARSLDADQNNSLDVGEDSLVGEVFGNDVLVDGDDDDEDLEVVDVDDALQKLRMLKAIGRIVAQAQAEDMSKQRKRFIGDTFAAIGNAVKDAFRTIGEKVLEIVGKSRKAFNKVVKGEVNFNDVLRKAKKYIHSGMTTKACKTAIGAAAGAILGPVASLAGAAAGPLCNAGLAELEKAAG